MEVHKLFLQCISALTVSSPLPRNDTPNAPVVISISEAIGNTSTESAPSRPLDFQTEVDARMAAIRPSIEALVHAQLQNMPFHRWDGPPRQVLLRNMASHCNKNTVPFSQVTDSGWKYLQRGRSILSSSGLATSPVAGTNN